MTKTCLQCKQEKSLDEFNKWNRSKDGRQVWCRICCKAERELNKAHYAALNKQYKIDNREHYNLLNAQWRKANPEKRSKIRLKYYQKNIETQRANNLARNKRNWERDKDKRYSYGSNYRALKRSAPGKVTTAEWKHLLTEYDNHCAYCVNRFDKLTQDHMQPLSRGGSHSIDNIVPACINCNSQKQKRTVSEYYMATQILPLLLQTVP